MQNGGFVNKIQVVRLSVAKIHRHVFENPGYTERTVASRRAGAEEPALSGLRVLYDAAREHDGGFIPSKL